ncbi:MAG: hypothetical protein Q9213_006377 [Squamulea squamosa]
MEPISPAQNLPVFYVGQHESKRQLPILPQTLRLALDCNYDMLTTPITTPLFHSRVLTLLSTHFLDLKDGDLKDITPRVSSLSATDTGVAPGETVSQLVGIASPWIDLASPDPIIHAVSRQVLELEVSYAAFCGLGNVVIPGPKLQYGSSHGEGVMQYAYAIQDLLALSNYTQILIHLPMMYHPDQDGEEVEGSLNLFARQEYTEEGGKSRHEYLGTWDAWHIIRTLCNYSSRLFIALSVPRHLPAIHAQSRWHSEPIRLLSLNAQTFLPNPEGKPVLTKDHQALIHRYMRLRTAPWILLCDVGPLPGLSDPEAKIPAADGAIPAKTSSDPELSPTPAEAGQKEHSTSRTSTSNRGPARHLSYIRELQQKSPPQSILEQFAAGYQDYLQGPLQPLSDNLESMTYEVFEKDPVKYELYESAIRRALTDWVSVGKTVSSPSGDIVVAVVGAGRGPLVTRALKASKDAGVKIELWAVEKNPNAFVQLQRHNELTWSNKVRLVQSDMRSWNGPVSSVTTQSSQAPHLQYQSHHPHSQQYRHNQSHQLKKGQTSLPSNSRYKIDILISELLGSFADNELSPECLDPLVTQHMNPTHGISIPSSYTSYITPITAPKLYADISSRTPNDPTAPNTPYVVMLHAVDYLSTAIPSAKDIPFKVGEPIVKAAWSFSHAPTMTSTAKTTDALTNDMGHGGINDNNDNKHNTRSARLSFPTPHRGCVHGLAGYFEAVLYGDIELSTHPLTMERKSPDMMSWFPIYFPLKTPLYFPDHSYLTVTLRRCTDGRKVWYEWMVESFLEPTPMVDNNRNSNDSRLSKVEMKRKIRLGVSELGSSKGSGCVM